MGNGGSVTDSLFPIHASGPNFERTMRITPSRRRRHRGRRQRRRNGVAADLVKGAIAGAVATWVMNQVTTLLYERENEHARQREDSARHGRTAYEVAAEKTARLTGRTLPERTRRRAGAAVHWGLGIGAGAAYAVMRRRATSLGLGGGLLFGSGFWLVMDEVAVYLFGLTPGPAAFPWQTHARGLVGHLTFGSVTDATLDLLDQVT